MNVLEFCWIYLCFLATFRLLGSGNVYEKLWQAVSQRSGQVPLPQWAHQSGFSQGRTSQWLPRASVDARQAFFVFFRCVLRVTHVLIRCGQYLGSRSPEPVKKKVLELIYSWTVALPDEAKILDAYQMLKKQGKMALSHHPLRKCLCSSWWLLVSSLPIRYH